MIFFSFNSTEYKSSFGTRSAPYVKKLRKLLSLSQCTKNYLGPIKRYNDFELNLELVF